MGRKQRAKGVKRFSQGAQREAHRGHGGTPRSLRLPVWCPTYDLTEGCWPEPPPPLTPLPQGGEGRVDLPALAPLGERAAAMRRRARGSPRLSILTWDRTLATLRLLPAAHCLLPTAFCFLLSVFLLLPSVLHAQGCAMCYTSASAARAGAKEALANGVLILLLPPMVFFALISVVVYRYRNKFRELSSSPLPVDYEGAGGGDQAKEDWNHRVSDVGHWSQRPSVARPAAGDN